MMIYKNYIWQYQFVICKFALVQVSMVAKQLQDIQGLIQYYQTYSDTHEELNKLYDLEARAKYLLGRTQRNAQIQVYALLTIFE